MERADAVGLFWEDAARNLRLNQKKGKGEKQPKAKREAPHPFWLESGYLPGLQEAREGRGVRWMEAADWKRARHDVFAWDTECYPTYFAVGFRHIMSGKVDRVIITPDDPLNNEKLSKLNWIFSNCAMRGFNSERYDATMMALAMGGCDNTVLKMCSDDLIVNNVWPTELLKRYRCHRIEFIEHVDLQEIAPGFQSLKTFGARMGVAKLQDLPFPPDRVLNADEQLCVGHYLHNDTEITAQLAKKLEGEIQLRANMSRQYGVDLLSASDAKIAETVLRTMYERKTGTRATVPKIEVGTAYQYKVPDYLHYRSKTMQDVLEKVRNTWFMVGASGHIDVPKELSDFKIKLGKSVYKLGNGGLHSTEKSVSHWCGDDEEMEDADVGSFYPRIILNQKLYPKHLGPALLEVYDEVVTTRLNAKHSGDKVVADSLKIVINSSFGKFGNKHSILYSPDFVIQVTLTGQLSLLMLIDALESVGIHVISANTDGIITRCKKSQVELKNKIYDWWQRTCGFELEYKKYLSTHNRDVNSYYAIYEEKDRKTGEVVKKAKRKGAYATAGLAATPHADICADAVEQFLMHGTHVEDTISSCNDPAKFAIVRNATGGAVWRDQFLGKVCRWYWSNAEDRDTLIYAKNGNRVPSSDDSRPLMQMDGLPTDIDYPAYIAHARSMLEELGVK